MAYLNDLKYINGHWVDQYTNDRVDGTAGDDTVSLFGGNDFFLDISGGNDYVFDVSSYTGAWSGQDVISTGIGNDTIVSSLDSPNSIYQYGGQEYYGGIGIDTLIFIPNMTGVAVDLDAAYAQNVITGEVTKALGFENVTGSAYNDYLYGDYQANVLNGYNGNDLIKGRGGDDTIDGGNDQDTLYGGDGNDHVYGGFGIDTIYGDAGNDYLYGGYDNDFISSGDGNDFADGGYGDDTIYGEAGDDVLFGSDGNDRVYGGSGRDILTGDNGNDVLMGGTGDDTIYGGAGNDQIYGGLGRDSLIGGQGADTFIFSSVSESTKSQPDRIYDFTHHVDKIDVALIDANTTKSGNQAFKYIGDHSFSKAGQISSHYDASHNETVVKFNTDHDSAAEMTLKLSGHVTLSSSDFIL